MTPLSTKNQRAEFKIDTLLTKLEFIVAKLPKVDLPATIKGIYFFGGILRDKRMLHDIDALFLYAQTPEHEERWERFRRNFTNVDFLGKGRSPLAKLSDLLLPYHEKGIPLAEAVSIPEVSQALIDRGIEPKWVGCFSWTEVFYNPHGLFFPYIERVLHGMLLKGVKGISVIFVEDDEFMQGKTRYSHLNSILVWNPEKPDIRANLFRRAPAEKTELLLKELGQFLNIITELKSGYEEIKSRVSQAPNKVKLDHDALEKSHYEIAFTAPKSYQELLESCEKARNEIRRYHEEISILKTIERVIPAIVAPEYPLENPVEELIALLTLISQPKYEVKEKRIREILRTLGLPEDKVKTVKKRGSKTEYELTEPIWKR